MNKMYSMPEGIDLKTVQVLHDVLCDLADVMEKEVNRSSDYLTRDRLQIALDAAHAALSEIV